MTREHEVIERLEAVRARCRAAGGDGVRIVGVTKGHDADAIVAAAAAGLDAVGESYAQELEAKGRALGPGFTADRSGGEWPEVHFIGGLQRNKVRRIAGLVDVWQSVDRPELVEEIARRAPGARVLVQVDISGETTKHGCRPEDAADLVQQAGAADLDVRGLMGIGPLGEPEDARRGFRLLRSLVDSLGLGECSMGMSADLEVAVEEGSTMIRVGTDLFGPRPPRA